MMVIARYTFVFAFNAYRPGGGEETMREPISSLRSLWARPGFLVRRLHQISVAIFLDEMAALELTPVQYGALMIVAAKPNIDQSTLAAELGVDRANAGDVLARMSKAGYVTRTPSANDRRFIQIKLTAEGTALLRKASARARKVQDRLLKPLAPSDRGVFIALITQIINGNDHLSRAPLRSGQIARARQVSADAQPKS